MPIEFFIPHEVAPKQADRTMIRFNADGVPYIHHYQPGTITRNAKALAAYCFAHVPAEPFDCPMFLRLVFQYPWPSHSTRKFRSKSRPKKTAPDVDQLCKQLCDVLEATGFVKNDSRFSHIDARKVWTDEVGVQVYMEEIED